MGERLWARVSDFAKVPKAYLVSELFDDLPALNPGQQKDTYAHELSDGYLFDTGIRKRTTF